MSSFVFGTLPLNIDIWILCLMWDAPTPSPCFKNGVTLSGIGRGSFCFVLSSTLRSVKVGAGVCLMAWFCLGVVRRLFEGNNKPPRPVATIPHLAGERSGINQEKKTRKPLTKKNLPPCPAQKNHRHSDLYFSDPKPQPGRINFGELKRRRK